MAKDLDPFESNLIMTLGVIGLIVNSLIFLLFPYLWLVPVATVLFHVDPNKYLGLLHLLLLGISAVIFLSIPVLITAHYKKWGFSIGFFWGFMNFLAAMVMDRFHNTDITGVSGLEPYTTASSELFFSTFFITLTLPAMLGYIGEKKPPIACLQRVHLFTDN